MDNVIAMAVLDGLQKLVDEAAHLVQLDSIRILFQHFEQVFVEVLEYQV